MTNLNERIARVQGATEVERRECETGPYWVAKTKAMPYWHIIPDREHDIAAAMGLVEELTSEGWCASFTGFVEDGRGWTVLFSRRGPGESALEDAPTLSEAISRAYLSVREG